MCGSVHRGVFSILGEYHEYIGGVKYIGGYHEYIREGDIMNTLGDVQLWYPPTFIMLSRCTHDIPHVLNIPMY